MTGFSSLAVAGEAQSSLRLVGEASVKGPKWARMPLLTIAMLGLQIVWSMEMAWGKLQSNGVILRDSHMGKISASPYLHDELGVKKSMVAMVFLAGPISGLVVQPFIGILADRSTSRFGRRKPYIIGGGLICIFGVFLLGFTRFFSGIVTVNGSTAVS
jgi:solute carrier family 45, member 1/2/4